jgi:hypothetical protein
MNCTKYVCASVLLLATALCAQTPAAVPVPSQLATAHTAFLASAAAPGLGRYENVIINLVYTDAYQALVKANHYQLLAAPAGAELSMTISVHNQIITVMRGDSMDGFFLRLEIYDTKTHSLLWAIDEPIQGAFREKTFAKNLDTSIALLMTDLNLLTTGKLPGDVEAAPTK